MKMDLIRYCNRGRGDRVGRCARDVVARFLNTLSEKRPVAIEVSGGGFFNQCPTTIMCVRGAGAVRGCWQNEDRQRAVDVRVEDQPGGRV